MGEFRTASEVRAGLTDAERALLRAIIDGRLAWSYWSALALAGHAEETAAGLEAARLVTGWRLPDGHALTLTPWGAWVCERVIVERVVVEGEELEEDPVWVQADKEDPASPEKEPPPLRLPKRAREIRCPWVEELPPEAARRLGFLMDAESGQEVRLFAGPDGKGGGLPVLIDRRLARKTQAQPRRRGPKRAG